MKHLLALTTVLIAACSGSDAGQAVTWKDMALEGKRFERIDDKLIEIFRFQGNGIVTAEIGGKGGAITGPIWYYRIDNEKLIVSESRDGASKVEMAEPRLKAGVLSVRLDVAQWAQYRVTPR